MKVVKKQLKNWWLLNDRVFFNCLKMHSQYANHINNGSFEEHYNCNFLPYISYSKYWRTIDSINGSAVYASQCYTNVPYNGFGFQYARSGNSYGLIEFLCVPPTCSANNNRGYFRNRLKSKLIAGKTYCVKFWANIGNNSTSYVKQQ